MDSLSSSSTLWAHATKEWVIPAKPKPGRKPKKEQAVVVKEVEEEAVDSKGRRVQNRAAQRAFRERKQSQLADLQARIQMYEQGEIERNVALQNVAKRLKEDNEKLRGENTTLQDRIRVLESQLQEHTKKRSAACLSDDVPEKKMRLGSADVTFSPAEHIHVFDASPISTPPSMVSSPASSCDSRASFDPSPEPLEPPSSPMVVDLPSSFLGSHQSCLSMPRIMDSTGIYGSTFDCGFCNEDTPCVCREIAMQEHQESLGGGIKNEELMPLTNVIDHPMQTTIVLPDPEQHPVLPPPKKSHKSILDNLPPYQPAVPLKRTAGRRTTTKFKFQLVQPAQSSGCSGDPTNCPACSDDSFGRAFCSAIGESMAGLSSCVNCPEGCKTTTKSDTPSAPASSPPGASPEPPASSPPEIHLPAPHARSDRIPTNDAWAQLKAHPHVAFADLKMLADVVAQRSKCTGPRVNLSPHPEVQEGLVDDSPVLLTDPHAPYKAPPDIGSASNQEGAGSAPSLTLVPQEELIRCSRQRVREVEADGVREALRLLDAKYGASS